MSSIAAQGTGVEIRATLFPVCFCGHPHDDHPAGHACALCPCRAYQRIKPGGDLGTRAFQAAGDLPLARRIGANVCWRIEVRLQRWRERLTRR